MIEEHAVIIAIPEHQANDHMPKATVMLERKVACGICGQKRGCGNATWGKLLGHASDGFEVLNPIGAKVGDSVIIAIEERVLLRSIMFMYLLPLLGMTIGALIVNSLEVHELYVFAGAISGLILSFMAVKYYLFPNVRSRPGPSLQHRDPLTRQVQSIILRLDN